MFIQKMFSGNLNRVQFFWRYIIVSLAVLLLIVIIALQSKNVIFLGQNYPLLIILLSLTLIFFRTSLYVKRLRDAGWTVWISVVSVLVPLDFILFLILLFIPGEQILNSKKINK